MKMTIHPCDKNLSWNLYKNALTSDYVDVQGGTTGEGIHTGVMAGTILIAIMSYAGVDLRSKTVKFNPNLPKHWRNISFCFNFVDDKYKCKISEKEINIYVKSDKKEIEIKVRDKIQKIECNEWIAIKF